MSTKDYGRWMSTFQGEDDMGGQHSFDEVSRALAAGTISRGRALKLAGAALLGSTGLLSMFPSVAEAEVQVADAQCERGRAINNRRCSINQCRNRFDCYCAATTECERRCVEIIFEETFCRRNQCNSSEECPQNEVCMKVGGCCEEGGRRNACVSPCG